MTTRNKSAGPAGPAEAGRRHRRPQSRILAPRARCIRGCATCWCRSLISAFIIIFLYQPVRVEGTSMLPMLEDQDRLFINKIAYRVGDIHQGDVVVFQYPRDHTKSYIKRVIALPGDRLRIDQGDVYVNGKRLPEPYVPTASPTIARSRRWCCRPMSTLSWATTAPSPATAATLARWTAT